VNTLISDLLQPSSEIAQVLASVSRGDFSQRMSLEVDARPLKGEWERAPEVAVGLLDFEGLRSFTGHGLESLSSERRPGNSVSSAKFRSRAPQLFSDLNQWMLKILLAPGIPEFYLSAARDHYRGASQLAEVAGVSVMSAFRFVDQFSKEGFLEHRGGRLRVVRSNELMNRWLAASQLRVLEIPRRWILNKDALADALRSYVSVGTMLPHDRRQLDRGLQSPRPRVCLGLFAAAEALGLGFVHGVEPHLYLERGHHRATPALRM
jgi:hypothetical protein